MKQFSITLSFSTSSSVSESTLKDVLKKHFNDELLTMQVIQNYTRDEYLKIFHTLLFATPIDTSSSKALFKNQLDLLSVYRIKENLQYDGQKSYLAGYFRGVRGKSVQNNRGPLPIVRRIYQSIIERAKDLNLEDNHPLLKQILDVFQIVESSVSELRK